MFEDVWKKAFLLPYQLVNLRVHCFNDVWLLPLRLYSVWIFKSTCWTKSLACLHKYPTLVAYFVHVENQVSFILINDMHTFIHICVKEVLTCAATANWSTWIGLLKLTFSPVNMFNCVISGELKITRTWKWTQKQWQQNKKFTSKKQNKNLEKDKIYLNFHCNILPESQSTCPKIEERFHWYSGDVKLNQLRQLWSL